jgi:hypothetical protein
MKFSVPQVQYRGATSEISQHWYALFCSVAVAVGVSLYGLRASAAAAMRSEGQDETGQARARTRFSSVCCSWGESCAQALPPFGLTSLAQECLKWRWIVHGYGFAPKPSLQ